MTEKKDINAQARVGRREFIRQGSKIVAGGAALMAGCGPELTPLTTIADMNQDMFDGLDLGGGSDLSDMQHDLGSDDVSNDAADDMATPEVVQFTKPPFLQLLGASVARLRFETRREEPLSVRLQRRGQSGQEFVATSNWQDLPEFEWPVPVLANTVEYPDRPGWHNMQDVVFEGLEPGEVYDWIVHQGNGVEWKGSFEVGRPNGSAFDLGWISDTMTPNSEAAIRALADLNPTLSLHGGDLQYMTHPLDTWSGFFHAWSPLTRKGAVHTCVGNHELEGLDEYELQYGRSFRGHGFEGSTLGYSYIDVAGVRILLMNSETDLFAESSAQRDWLIAHLEAVKNSTSLRFAIVAYHRPFFTMSKSVPNFEARDRLHPLFRDYGVPLVLNGHNHCYERYEVEGVTYIMDGGGGALSYGVDDSRDVVLAERPGDEMLRKVASATYGVTMVRVQADNTIKLERYKSTESVPMDEYTIG